jgi:nucleoside-diphosphate-sugar epimerase
MTLDETATHAWIFIDDLVKAMFAGETELGGEFISNKEIVLMLEDISGKKLRYISGILRNYNCADVPAPGIGYTSLYEGLKQTYEYFTRKDN